MSRSKQKGTLAETAVVEYLRQFWPLVERRTLGGKFDKGDIAGVPDTVIEVKNQKSYKIPEWLEETAIETENAEAKRGILVIKPKGIGVSRVNEWWAVVPLSVIVELLKDVDVERLQP